MINITVRFGSTNEITKEVRDGITVDQVLRDASFKAALGFGDNVQGLIDGAVQPGSNTLEDGDTLVVETRANSKASN